MGNGTSLVVETQLLEALSLELKKDAKERKKLDGSSCSDEEEEEDEDDDEKDDTDVQQTSLKPEDSRDLLLFQKIDRLLSKWSLDNAFRDDVIMTDLLDVDDAIHQAFLTGRTPLILDTSPDDKLSTYLSYQPNVVLLEARSMIVDSSRQPLLVVMDHARSRLVGAMKYGKTLVIRMGTSAPDFKATFNDDVLIEKGLIAPYPKDDPSARILARNKRRNSSMAIKQQQERDRVKAGWHPRSSASQKDLEEDKDDDDEGEEDEGEVDVHVDEEEEDEEVEVDPPVHVGEAYFPLEALERGGEGLKTGGWAERLFREEDMKPHKNFAYCRDEFRVLLISQLSLVDVQEYLFGPHWGGLPLPKEKYKVVNVVYEEEGEGEGPGEEELGQRPRVEDDGDEEEEEDGEEVVHGSSKSAKTSSSTSASGCGKQGTQPQPQRPVVRQRHQMTSASAPSLLSQTEAHWLVRGAKK